MGRKNISLKAFLKIKFAILLQVVPEREFFLKDGEMFWFLFDFQ